MTPLRNFVNDGLTFDVSDSGGNGEAVILLHGFPQSKESWDALTPHLTGAGYRVLAPDQRGYSPDARPGGVEHYRMPALLADALAVLDHVGVPAAHVVGHDWGAAVAWHVAGRHPQRVRTLTAVSVPHPVAFVEALRSDPDQRARSRYMKDWLDPAAEESLLSGGLEQALGGVPGVDTEAYLRVLREPGALTAALSWYRAQSLADLEGLGPVTAPTLHVWSDADPALGPTGARTTGDHVAGPYRLEVLAGISHWVPEQAPEQLSELVLEHLRSCG